MTYQIGFVMDQIAGHITNYRNLRAVAAQDSGIQADWHEIYYFKEGGAFERLRKALPFIPSYATGVGRGSWEIYRATRGKQYDALYTNASTFVFFTHLFQRMPTLLEFDSTPVLIDQMEAYGSTPDPLPVAKLKWKLASRAYEAAALIQVWSRWAQASLINDYFIDAQKIVVNPPGVNLDYWRPGPSRNTPSENRPLKVLFVGGDFRRKGGELLLKWYQTQRPEEVELHVVTREEVATQPGIHVYHGVQPNSDQLIQLYQNSDLFVLPSLGECFGIATVEAMAAGLPVIASDVGGTADIIEPGRNGYIVPGKDARALSQAIDGILGDESRRESMGVQSRQLAEERFNLRTNASRTLANLKQLAEREQPQAQAIQVEGSR